MIPSGTENMFAITAVRPSADDREGNRHMTRRTVVESARDKDPDREPRCNDLVGRSRGQRSDTPHTALASHLGERLTRPCCLLFVPEDKISAYTS